MTRAVNTALAGSGGVLQVVSATKTDTATITSATYVDVVGLSATITPISSSSTILILVNATVNPANGVGSLWQVVRGSTAIAVNNASSPSTGGVYTDTGGSAGSSWVATSAVYLDSPATTSPTTYKVQARSTSAATIGINRRSAAADFGGISTITVMEIAG